MLPSAISLGGDTGEFRFNSIRASNDKFVGLRAPQTLVNSYRMRFPEGPGSQDNCLKRGTGAAMSDNIYDYALYFGACAGEGQDWISAVQDGASNNHNSTVYSPNQGDRVGWRVIRSRGTVLAPENVLVNDYVSSEEYSALIGGSVFPVFGVKVIRTTNTPTSIGTMAFQTNDAAGVFYNKLIINDNVYIDNGHLGSSTIRVPKIWVHDFDCDGTGCGGGGGVWTRNSTSGFLYPTTQTDDVRITNKLKWRDNSNTPPADLDFDSYAVIGSVAQSRYLVFRDNAGAEMLKLERMFTGTVSKRAIFDSSVDPLVDVTYPLGSAAKRWTTVFVQNLDCTGNCGHWYRNTAAGYVRPATTTDDVRTRAKFVFEEPQSGVVTMDILAQVGNPATNTISMAFRDMAGAEMLRLERQFLGTTSNLATFDMSILPKTNNLFNLGSPSQYFNLAHFVNGYMQTVRPIAGNASIRSFTNWNPSAGDTWSLGTDDQSRWLKVWAKDIDAYGTATVGNLNVTNIVCTGSCPGQSYWSRDTSVGFVRPLTLTDDVRISNKLVFQDVNAASSLSTFTFDIYASVGVAGSRWMVFRDNAGAEMLRLERMFLTSVSNVATFDMSVVPKSNGNRNLGDTVNYWGELRVNDTYTIALRPKSATSLDVFGGMNPSTDNSANFTLGSASKRWYQVYAMGVQTNGLSGVSGSGQVLSYGHFIPATTATYTLGTAALRWNYVYTSNLDTTNFSVTSLSVTTLTVGGAASISSTLSVGSTLTTRNITPSTSGTYSIGDSGTKYANLYLSGTAFVTGLSNSGSNISVQSPLVPSSGGTYDLGGSTARWRGGYFQDINVSATITANGSAGQSKTVTIQAGCFFTFSLGIMTNTNCT
jgi:hypothetical protein